MILYLGHTVSDGIYHIQVRVRSVAWDSLAWDDWEARLNIRMVIYRLLGSKE